MRCGASIRLLRARDIFYGCSTISPASTAVLAPGRFAPASKLSFCIGIRPNFCSLGREHKFSNYWSNVMIESKSDIWNSDAGYICVTTNGIVKRDGALVMGAGIAKQARDRYPGIDKFFGHCVNELGNVPFVFKCTGVGARIISLPTKHHWKDKSDLKLIVESVSSIKNYMVPDDTIALTRPGCALGGLDWESTVKPAIEPLLDDRFTVYHR